LKHDLHVCDLAGCRAVTGLVYTYLAGHVGRTGDEGAFQALTRGYACSLGIWQIGET